ncbi:Thiosulfate sulfurtransferase, rhodanese [[Actinomadura] parvosata subsp. kistnae]|uniref:Sulfurtransferase n=1 Tax=[Actinomadura] parvosata subsp. kistnae TaxID=1909395 RepID=A0A1V0AI90_9ACTN|nr:sulfurtransferase [Nonomuraea sp. ATCC 55076]AQZ69926.1 sulfurtransferase [Nonomuraea sp. ATCC 55076]SPL90251.1 Thiosulfate sulfurtransferase, rhodanese [Actinomadura parvosata subsp. kistnae]
MTSPLITATDLAALTEPAGAVTVLDVRWRLGGPPGLDFYREGHIEGAVYCDLDTDLAAPTSAGGRGGRHPLPDAAAFESAMRRLGVSGGRPVVVYDDAGATVAARAWWALRYFGHQDVRVLDGGLQAWIEAGLPVTKDVPQPVPGDFTARPGGMPALTADEAATLAGQGILLDARAAERYRGEVEPIDPVAGHVPGAVSAPTTANLGPDGRFLAPSELRARFGGLGVREGEAVGAYCGSGVTAAHEVLALEVAGLPASLYVGSWSDWVSDPSRPVATGDR